MNLLLLVLIVAICAMVLIWAIWRYLPIDIFIKQIISFAVVVLLLFWILLITGALASLGVH